MADDITPEESAGRALRRMREERGMSQREVAEKMTASGHEWRQGTVSMTEAGQRPLRVNELVALADLFGVTLEAMVMLDPFRGMTVAQTQADLETLTAEVASLDVKIAEADAQASAAGDRADSLRSSRAKYARLAGLAREFLDREGGQR